jgi:hypothetical protein
MVDAAKMIAFDLLVHLPLIYFPTFYVFKEFVYEPGNPVKCVSDGIGKWSGNFKDDWLATLKVWGPADLVQFGGLLALQWRMPFRHMVSFFWTAYVSYSRA